MEFKAINQIQARPVDRLITGIEGIDWLYGYSKNLNGYPYVWGMPAHRVSLWSAESGTGKSRLALELAKTVVNCGISKVLYIQTEAPLEDFAGWVTGIRFPQNFIVSRAKTMAEIMQVIYTVQAQLVIVDSINEVEEFENGTKAESKFVMNGGHGGKGFRDAVNDIKCHIVLLNQLNQDGSIKGGTSLVHLLDHHMELVGYEKRDKTKFYFRVGIKNRQARSGPDMNVVFEHREEGVAPIRENQIHDKVWCSTHGIPVTKHPSQMTPQEAYDGGWLSQEHGDMLAPVLGHPEAPKGRKKWSLGWWILGAGE